MPAPINESVVVITGASSGIGRATALAFASQGASVVLAARREQALQEVAQQCLIAGGHSLVVMADVTDEGQVQRVAERAVEHFGRIDTWVNNAGVGLFARFEEAPADLFRRVVDTNFFGAVHGARAALPEFRRQGSGVLINVSSAAALGQPYTTAYVASKAALLAFNESLRLEFQLDDVEDLHACAVLPASVDTPFFQHAANYTGRAVKPMAPIYDPEDVARAIVGLAQEPKREVYVGKAPKLLAFEHVTMPGLMERTYPHMVDREHLAAESVEPTQGNVLEPMPQWASIRGDWKPAEPPRSRLPAIAATAAGVAASAVALSRLRNGRDRGEMNRLRRLGSRIPGMR